MSLMKKLAKMLEQDSRSKKVAQPMKKQIKKLAKSVDDIQYIIDEFRVAQAQGITEEDMGYENLAGSLADLKDIQSQCTADAQGQELCDAVSELTQDFSQYTQFGEKGSFDAEGFVDSLSDSVDALEQAYNNYKSKKQASSFFGIKRRSKRR
jgi:hypothetical protein